MYDTGADTTMAVNEPATDIFAPDPIPARAKEHLAGIPSKYKDDWQAITLDVCFGCGQVKMRSLPRVFKECCDKETVAYLVLAKPLYS